MMLLYLTLCVIRSSNPALTSKDGCWLEEVVRSKMRVENLGKFGEMMFFPRDLRKNACSVICMLYFKERRRKSTSRMSLG